MPSSRQILSLTLLPLAFALPQPQTADTGAWGAGSTPAVDGGVSPAAGGDTWGASPTAAVDSWAASPTAVGGEGWAATTVAPVAGSAGVATPYDPNAWETQVTYPAGCQTWANPCPSGAIQAPGTEVAPTATGSAAWEASGPYTNGFTSYLTQTNSAGIVTGGPSVQTVAAGVSSTPSMQTTVAPGSSSTSIDVFGANATTSSPTGTSTGFAQQTDNAAVGLKTSAALGALAAAIAVLL